MKPLKIATLFMALLMVMLPVTMAQQFTGAAVSGQGLVLDISAPRYSKSTRVDITGTTAPDAQLEVLVNNKKVRTSSADSQGNIALNNVPLDSIDNTVKVKATDSFGNTAEKTAQVTIDRKPPTIQITQAPDAVVSTTATISGTVDEPVTLYYDSKSTADLTAPPRITGMTATKVEANLVEIQWGPSADQDLLEYAVYRDGKRIGVTNNPSYSDNTASSDVTYVYAASAVDQNCNEGQKSLGLTVTTLEGGNPQAEPADTKLSCEKDTPSRQVTDQFTITVPVGAGNNEVTLNAIDAGGNSAKITKNIVYDIGPPSFVSTNLQGLGPSYIPLVTVRGVVSEQAAVHIYVNDELEEIVQTEVNGSFEQEIQLKADVQVQVGTQTDIDTGVGWKNEIKLIAIDAAGYESAPYGPVDVPYALCGLGSWYDVNFDLPLPSSLVPRMILEGTQQINIPFNLTYVGPNTAELEIAAAGGVQAIPVALNPGMEPYYDNDKVQVSSFISPAGQGNAVGLIQIQFNPWDPLPDSTNPMEKEAEIAEHRKGRGGLPTVDLGPRGTVFQPPETCTLPELGCMRFYLELEIPFKEVIPQPSFATPGLQQTLGDRRVPRRQRSCIPDLELKIEPVIPPDVYPVNLLNDTVQYLDRAIEYIDQVLDPVTEIGEVVMYFCLAGHLGLWYTSLQERVACRTGSFGQLVGALKGEARPWHKEIAEAGLCGAAYNYTAYEEGSDLYKTVKNQWSSCDWCQSSIRNKIHYKQGSFNPVCDRIFCPKAPSLRMHIKNQANKVKDITPWIKEEWNWQAGKAGEDPGFSTEKIDGNVNGKLYQGDSCALSEFTNKQGYPKVITNQFSSGATLQTGTAWNAAPSSLGTKELYKLYEPGEAQWPAHCRSATHPADPRCCAMDYEYEWDSACGTGGPRYVRYVDTYNELKHSYCLAAQKTGNSDQAVCNRIPVLSNVWNAVTGFCDADTQAAGANAIYTGLSFKPRKDQAQSNMLYIFTKPKSPEPSGGEVAFTVHKGYVATTAAYTQANATAGETQARLTQTISEIRIGGDMGEAILGANKSKSAAVAVLQSEICNMVEGCSNTKLEEIYDRIKSAVGTPGVEYIVDPSSSLFTSTRCVCFPGFISHMEMWRGAMTDARNCFADAGTTGNIQSGYCRQFISNTVCELLWEAITCFINWMSSPPTGVGGSRSTGTGGIGALFSAISDTSNEVQGRYGQTSMWNALFNEKQFVHGACMWAFTGSWDFDVAGAFRQGVDAQPVNSIAQIGPMCQRRFLGYNPTVQGLTSWEYSIPLYVRPGADITYQTKLKCSTGFGCAPTDGYPGGECDCNRLGQEQTVVVNSPELGTGQRKKGETLDALARIPIQANSGARANFRYDKAEFTYSWRDQSTNEMMTESVECDINQVGDIPPAYCNFDLFQAAFRCRYGEIESAIRILSIDTKKADPGSAPQPTDVKYQGADEAFGIGATPSFVLQIRQQMPQDPAKLATSKKFVLYSIKNQVGRVLSNLSTKYVPSDFTLQTNGDYSKHIVPINNFKISEDSFKGSAQNATATPCKDPKSPATWTVRFTIHDSTQNGRPGAISVDPSTGRAQEFTETFNAICEDHAKLANEPKGTAQPSPPAKQVQPTVNATNQTTTNQTNTSSPAAGAAVLSITGNAIFPTFTCKDKGGVCGYTATECSALSGTAIGKLDCTQGTYCCDFTQ